MNAIHIIMATRISANPHNTPNEHVENIAKKRKISAITFLVFGILFIIAGSLLGPYESQRFCASFIVFGVVGVIFAFIYWISAEKLLIALRKLNIDRMRQAQLQAQHSGEFMNNENFEGYTHSTHMNLPSYEQSVLPHIESIISEIPPPYEEAIKIKSVESSSQPMPINSISLSVDQTANTASTSGELPNRKSSTTNVSSQ